MTDLPVARLLLVGFMGSGKSSVGRRVAEALGWRFVDFDDVIEARFEMPVAEIFASHGERLFREAETEVANRLLAEHGVVLASGGGWAAQPGRLDSLPPGTVAIWLQVGADEALRRASAEEGKRPLLAGVNRLDDARKLLADRVRFYSSAGWSVDTERSSVEDVAARVLRILAEIETETDAE